MKQAKPNNEWAVALQEALRPNKTPSGPGWKTISELSDELNVCVGSVSRMLRELKRKGKVDRFQGSMAGHVTYWYRLKK